MATPAFFNYEIYMTNKLVQMQKAEPTVGWTMTKLMDAFTQNGFAGADGAYTHFTQFGAAEDVAPNASFNANEYYAAKAAQFYGVEAKAVTEFQIASIKQTINANGMNAWTHYQQFGSTEGVNPSNSFDAAAYLAAKATAMGGEWTAATVADAIKANGMTVLEHYLTYAGTGTTEVAQGATYPVAADKKVPSDVKGNTYELTVDRDTFTGTSQDDMFIADIKNATETLNVSDVLDGGAGFDTLTVYGDKNAANLTTASITNVEKIVAVGTTATASGTAMLDVSAMAGVTEAWVKNGVASSTNTLSVTATKAQTVGFEGTAPAAATVTFKDASGAADAATVALNGVKGTSVTVAVDAGHEIEAQTLNLAGKSTLTTFSNAKMTSLTITGDGSLASGVAATPATAVTAGSTLLKTVDASAATGDLNLSFTQAQLNATEFAYTGSKGADKIAFDGAATQKATVNLGTGDDTLSLKVVGLTGSTYNGGDGTDTLVLNDITTLTTAQGKMFTGFENLKLDGTTAAHYEVGQIAGITSYEVANTTDATITKLADGATVTASADVMAAVTLNLADPSAATSALNITLDNGAKAVAKGVDLTTLMTNAHVLNVASKGMVNTTDANGVILSGASLDNLTNISISGDQALDLTTGAANALTLIDGSSATGKLTITATGATKAMTIKGGSADDTITGTANGDTLIGGAGNDKLIGGAGADTMTGGAGKDKFVIETATVATVADADTVTDFLTKVDTLSFGGAAGSASNFAKATTVATDFATALTAAKAAFTATVFYDVQQVGGDSYVFFDSDGSGSTNTTVMCVKLTGVALDGIVAGDIVA